MVTLGRETDLSSLWPRDASMLKQGLIGGATLIVHRPVDDRNRTISVNFGISVVSFRFGKIKKYRNIIIKLFCSIF